MTRAEFDNDAYEAEVSRVRSEWTRANAARDSARVAEHLAAGQLRRSVDPASQPPTSGGTAVGRVAAVVAAGYAAEQSAAYRATVTDIRRHNEAQAQARPSAPQRPMTAVERRMDEDAKRRRAAALDNDAA